MNKKLTTAGLFISMLIPGFTVMAEDTGSVDAAQQYNQLIEKFENNQSEYKSLDLSTGLNITTSMEDGSMLPFEFIMEGFVSSDLESAKFDLSLNLEDEEDVNYKMIFKDDWLYLLDSSVGHWTKELVENNNEDIDNTKEEFTNILKNGGKLDEESSAIFNKYFELVSEEDSNIIVFSLKDDINPIELYDDLVYILSTNEETNESIEKINENEEMVKSLVKQIIEYSPILEIGVDSELGYVKYINFDININKDMVIDELKDSFLYNILEELNSVDIELNSTIDALNSELDISIPDDAKDAVEVENMPNLNDTNIETEDTNDKTENE